MTKRQCKPKPEIAWFVWSPDTETYIGPAHESRKTALEFLRNPDSGFFGTYKVVRVWLCPVS